MEIALRDCPAIPHNGSRWEFVEDGSVWYADNVEPYFSIERGMIVFILYLHRPPNIIERTAVLSAHRFIQEMDLNDAA